MLTGRLHRLRRLEQAQARHAALNHEIEALIAELGSYPGGEAEVRSIIEEIENRRRKEGAPLC